MADKLILSAGYGCDMTFFDDKPEQRLPATGIRVHFHGFQFLPTARMLLKTTMVRCEVNMARLVYRNWRVLND